LGESGLNQNEVAAWRSHCLTLLSTRLLLFFNSFDSDTNIIENYKSSEKHGTKDLSANKADNEQKPKPYFLLF